MHRNIESCNDLLKRLIIILKEKNVMNTKQNKETSTVFPVLQKHTRAQNGSKGRITAQ